MTQSAAGVIAGILAGSAYLIAQVAFTAAATHGGAFAPLQRIAAILMGPDAAPPPVEFSLVVFGMALIIHAGLSLTYGQLVASLTWKRTDRESLMIGALAGLALYAINFGLIAPSAFPWFADSVQLAAAADHLLFGLSAAAICIGLRRLSAST